nr:unnamed protein product [Callosobruchus analis]
MPTRQNQVEFEQTLIDALKKKNVAESISKIIIDSITSSLADKFSYYDSKIAELENEIIKLKTEYSHHNINPTDDKPHRNVEQKLDDVQQQLKNNNIRIINVPEVADENLIEKVLPIFKNTMKINMTQPDITAVYRVGRQTDGDKPRHVLVTFKENSTKMLVYNKKKMLKGTRMVIKEDLTARRLKIVKTACDKYGFKNVWTVNGKIFGKTEKGVEKLGLEIQ